MRWPLCWCGSRNLHTSIYTSPWGGIKSIEDTADENILHVILFHVLANPELITEGAQKLNNVAGIAHETDEETCEWHAYTHGGRKRTGGKALDWAKEYVVRGAGELLVTSMDKDGKIRLWYWTI